MSPIELGSSPSVSSPEMSRSRPISARASRYGVRSSISPRWIERANAASNPAPSPIASQLNTWLPISLSPRQPSCIAISPTTPSSNAVTPRTAFAACAEPLISGATASAGVRRMVWGSAEPTTAATKPASTRRAAQGRTAGMPAAVMPPIQIAARPSRPTSAYSSRLHTIGTVMAARKNSRAAPPIPTYRRPEINKVLITAPDRFPRSG